MKRYFGILASLIFAFGTLLLQGGAGAAVAAQSGAADDGGPPTQAFHLGNRQPGEIAALRTRNSRTFAENGYDVAQFSSESLNYQDSSGTWQPIDNTLVPVGDGYRNTANRYTVSLPADIGQNPVRVETSRSPGQPASWISFSLAGSHGSGSASGSTMTYALPGATLALTAESDALKETITLANPSSPTSFTWNLHVGPGMQAQQNDAGGIDFIDSSAQSVFTFTPPFMTDASGAVSHAVTMTLGTDGSTVTVSADQSWLADSARAWPVVIDPTVSVLNTSQACTIANSTYANLAYCPNPREVGYNLGYAYRSLFQFSLAGIPGNSQVLNADFALPLTASYSSSPQEVDLYALTQGWNTQAGWNKYNGISAWTTPGGDYTTSGSVRNTAVGPTVQTYHWYPTMLVQNWVNGTMANDGVLLREPTETSTDAEKFGAATLTVSYIPNIGAQNFNTFTDVTSLDDRLDLGVNPVNGNLLLHESDISIPGVGLPLTLDRSYNNLSPAQSEVGNGWLLSTGADTGLSIFGDGSVDYHGPSGYQIPFIHNSDGSFSAPPGIDSTLVKNSDGTYSLTVNGSSVKYTYSSGGVLTAESDPNGNTLSFSYSGSQLTSITDTQGRSTSFTYTNGLLSSVTDPAGHSYSYAYDASKNLITYTDPAGKQTSFTYDASGNLSQITDPLGIITELLYDSSKRVTSVIRNHNPLGHDGPTTTFTYTSGTTVVADPNGHTTTYAYDAYNRLTTKTDADNRVWQLAWTSDNHVSQATQPNGSTATTTYDTLNRATQTTDPAGMYATATYGDSAHPYLPTSTTDDLGHTSSVTYTASGEVSGTTDPLGDTASATYNSNGTPASSTDPNQHTTSATYTNGLPTKVTPPGPAGSQSATYTGSNLPATTTDGKGQTSTYGYDALNRLVRASYADGTSKGYAYDADGNLLSVSDSTGTTTYSYDALNRLVTELLPSQKTITYVYDAAGELTSKIDANGTTTYSYDPAGQPTTVVGSKSQQYQLSTQLSQGMITRTIVFPNGITGTLTYDSDGRPAGATYTNSSGQTILHTWNSYCDDGANDCGEPNCTTSVCHWNLCTMVAGVCNPQDPHPKTSADFMGTHTLTYDSAGRIVQDVISNSTVGANGTYTYHYDAAGNLIEELDAGIVIYRNYNYDNQLTQSGTTTASYDANGNMISTSSGSSYGYNSGGDLTSANGSSASNGAQTFTINGKTYTTDANGQIDSILGPDTMVYITYAPDGTPMEADVNGVIYYLLTDADGSVMAVSDAVGNIVENCGYNAVSGAASCSGNFGQPPIGFEGDINLGNGLILDPSFGLIDTNLATIVTTSVSTDPFGDDAPDAGDGSGDVRRFQACGYNGWKCAHVSIEACAHISPWNGVNCAAFSTEIRADVRWNGVSVYVIGKPTCTDGGGVSYTKEECDVANNGGAWTGYLTIREVVKTCATPVSFGGVTLGPCTDHTIDINVYNNGHATADQTGGWWP